MTESAPLVYLIDDDAAVRDAITDLLASVGLNALAFADTGDFLARWRDAPEHSAACLLLDIRMPGQSGLEFQKQLRAMKLDLPVIFITAHGDVPMSVQAMKAGAVDFLGKPFREQELLDAIWHALERNRCQRRQLAEQQQLQQRWQSLNAGEQAVALGVVRGRLNKQIAADLCVSEITVKVRRANALRKLQLRTAADLVRALERLDIR